MQEPKKIATEAAENLNRKTLNIEVFIDGNDSPKVKINATENSSEDDIVVMTSAGVGVVYTIIKGVKMNQKKRMRIKLLEMIQRFMTLSDKNGLTQD